MDIKLTYHDKIYTSPGITEKDLLRIRRKLDRTPLKCDVYLITAGSSKENILEFYHCRQLRQEQYGTHIPHVIGIAGTYEEAVGLIKNLFCECLEVRGDCHLREFLA